MATNLTVPHFVEADTVQFYDDRYAAGYMEEWPQWKKQRVVAMLRRLHLPATGSAIDFGCGQGVFADVLRQVLPGWTIYGTDLSAVAVATAARRYPQCRFFHWSDAASETHARHFDLLFSHHVLEHVIDLDETWQKMSELLKPAAAMLHVLPCGDAGSFEHNLCCLKVDGIDRVTGAFYYEEEGHLRRLDTRTLMTSAAAHGFAMGHARYANEFWGGVEWITAAGPHFVRTLITPSESTSAAAASRLQRWQRTLLMLAVMRLPSARGKLRDLARRAPASLPAFARLAAGVAAYPIAYLLDRWLNRAADREWQSATTGSEIYAVFVRRPPTRKRPAF